MITLTCFPRGKAPVYSVKKIDYTSLEAVYSNVTEMVHAQPLVEYFPEPPEEENQP